VFGQTAPDKRARFSVTGVIKDVLHAPIADTRIEFRRVGGGSTKIKTNIEGEYRVSLKPGIYTVRARMLGFQDYKVERFEVPTDSAALTLNIDMVVTGVT
jgi:Carboxypeptidase regulatory-like domain